MARADIINLDIKALLLLGAENTKPRLAISEKSAFLLLLTCQGRVKKENLLTCKHFPLFLEKEKRDGGEFTN